jgi:hypothetical protein
MAFVNLQRIRSKADLIGTLNPAAWDAVHPHIQFAFSNAHVDLYVADVAKQVSAALADKTLAKNLHELSKRMGGAAGAVVVSAWEPGDELCPPWPWPFPFPGPVVDGPQPDPWIEVNAAVQVELAHILIRLAGLTSSLDFNKELKVIATGIARGAAGALAEDFERCGTKPRPPFVAPHR